MKYPKGKRRAHPKLSSRYTPSVAEIAPCECEIQTRFDQYMMGFAYNA